VGSTRGATLHKLADEHAQHLRARQRDELEVHVRERVVRGIVDKLVRGSED
jgi:hypothetical protein